jgi:hypothetical protein
LPSQAYGPEKRVVRDDVSLSDEVTTTKRDDVLKDNHNLKSLVMTSLSDEVTSTERDDVLKTFEET